MRRYLSRFAAVVCFAALVVVFAAFPAVAGEVTSRMRTVSGVFESNGYRVEPVFDVAPDADPRDLVTPQVYEIIRPDINAELTVGRLFTSCSCIQLEAEKRTFAPGERAILVLRNVRATPKDGQMYAFFVQMRSPLETTLRFDTFVQSGVGIGAKTSSSDSVTPAPVDADGHRPVGNPVPGLNNQLAAALSAVGTAAESTADLLDGTDDASSAEADAASRAGAALDEELAAASGAASSGEEALGTADLSAELSADLDADLPDFNAQPGENSLRPPAADAAAPNPATGGSDAAEPAEPAEPAADAGEDVSSSAAAPAAGLNEEQQLQVQQLALLQAEEQAKQLAERVQQLQAGAGAAGTAGADGGNASASVAASIPLSDRPVQAVSLITIGVRDMPASIRFYEALGWQRAARGKYDQTAFFQLNGQVLALYPVADLLAEQNMASAAPAPGGITLALHVRGKEDVSDVYQRFIDAGGKSLRAPAEMASGAVSSYVADPDGNPWEISWVPQFTLDPNGDLWLP